MLAATLARVLKEVGRTRPAPRRRLAGLVGGALLLGAGAPPNVEACGQTPASLAGTVSYWSGKLEDRSAATRLQAAEALGETRSEGAVAPLVRALGDADGGVRRGALRALRRIGPSARPAAAAVRESLRDADADVRAEAALTLDAIAPPR
jgi:hypothetical protein